MSKNIFNSVQLGRPKRNNFDLSHDVKLSFDAGELIPICAMPTIPGDKFYIGCESLTRMAPMVSPVMHRVDQTIHYFFVPNRLLWPNWEKFITNTRDEDGNAFTAPYLFNTSDNYANFPLLDYMGIGDPSGGSNIMDLNALPFAAYQMIYNEYYRDQKLIDPIPFQLADGNNASNTDALLALRRRAWQHDYFTAALPYAQQGAEGVSIPLGDVKLADDWEDTTPTFRNNADGDPSDGTIVNDPAGSIKAVGSGTAQPITYDPEGSLDIEPTTINDLRRAFRLQEWLERNARAGVRYVENILGHFGIKSSDARLQRPEYITGIKSPIVISEVLNTTGQVSDTGDPLPQGNMAGHGIGVTSGKTGTYFCEEHGWIIGIMSVMPRTAYQQGINRTMLNFFTKDPLNYFWPSFANIGEQEVIGAELYLGGSSGTTTFGYVPRYAEYKFMPSRVAGDFKTSLDFWHWGRIFGSSPFLNKDFIECNPDKRIFAVEDPDTDSFYCHVYNKIQASRLMPKFGTPTF